MCPPAVSTFDAVACVTSLKQGCCADEASYRSLIGVMLEDELDRRQAPDEQLFAWEAQQQAVVSRCRSVQLDAPSRAVALKLIWDVAMTTRVDERVSAQPNACWFDAVQLFDMSSADLVNASKAKVVTRALAACLATLKLATSNKRRVPIAMREHLVARAASFGATLGDGAVTKADVEIEERQLLFKMALGLLMPTTAKWLDTFWTRFDVATRGRFATVVAAARCLGMTWAALCTWSVAASAERTPRATAEGICGAVLVSMGLISPEALRSQHVESDQWCQVCGVVATASQVAPQPGVAPPEVLLTALLFATKGDLAALRGSTLVIMDSLRGSLAPNTPAL